MDITFLFPFITGEFKHVLCHRGCANKPGWVKHMTYELESAQGEGLSGPQTFTLAVVTGLLWWWGFHPLWQLVHQQKQYHRHKYHHCNQRPCFGYCGRASNIATKAQKELRLWDPNSIMDRSPAMVRAPYMAAVERLPPTMAASTLATLQEQSPPSHWEIQIWES